MGVALCVRRSGVVRLVGCCIHVATICCKLSHTHTYIGAHVWEREREGGRQTDYLESVWGAQFAVVAFNYACLHSEVYFVSP